jgi:hypothetical protein
MKSLLLTRFPSCILYENPAECRPAIGGMGEVLHLIEFANSSLEIFRKENLYPS